MSPNTGGRKPEKSPRARSGSRSPAPADSGALRARRFGDYQLQLRLGAGGFGEIYQAEHLPTNRRGILKRVRADQTGSALAQRRFEFEMELGKLLRHPNLVRVIDSGRVEGRQYLFMEEIRGPSLRRMLQGNAPWEVTTQVLLQAIEQIARGVAHVHRVGVVHGDLKPENVLFHSPRQPVVIDFGLAFRKGVTRPAQNQALMCSASRLMGTPMYMAPELISGAAIQPTPGWDSYALGVMLYEVLAGRPPFVLDATAATDAALEKLVAAVANDPPPPIRQFRPEVPAAWDQLCGQLLEKKPGRRLMSLDQVAQDINTIQRTGRLPATGRGGGRGLMRRLASWFE